MLFVNLGLQMSPVFALISFLNWKDGRWIASLFGARRDGKKTEGSWIALSSAPREDDGGRSPPSACRRGRILALLEVFPDKGS